MEIIIGLPHLRQGPILDRAITMQQPALISANCLSRWNAARGLREWAGWELRPLKNASRLKSLDLDSAGFVATAHYGGLPWTIEAYIELAASFPFRRFASIDYCCEAEIAHDRTEVLERISRTIATNRQCYALARDYGIHHRFMPVLQGRTPADYLRCADALSHLIDTQEFIGIGSMCRRPIHGEQGLLAVITSLVDTLPSTTRFHLFGVKGAAIPWLKPFGDRIASIDSQAWGVTARFDALKSGVSKTDAFAADTLEQWTIAQLSRTREMPRRAKAAAATEENQAIEKDSWRHAIALAQQQFRELIEEGALDHDEITSCWIEQTAADIYHSRQAQP